MTTTQQMEIQASHLLKCERVSTLAVMQAPGYLTLAIGLRSTSVSAKRVPPAHSTAKYTANMSAWLVAGSNKEVCASHKNARDTDFFLTNGS